MGTGWAAGPHPWESRLGKGSDLHPEKQAHVMENEKDEACPPLQLKKGEQRHRGAWSPIPGPWGLGRLRKRCVWWHERDGLLGFASVYTLQRGDRGREGGGQLLRVTQQWGREPGSPVSIQALFPWASAPNLPQGPPVPEMPEMPRRPCWRPSAQRRSGSPRSLTGEQAQPLPLPTTARKCVQPP